MNEKTEIVRAEGLISKRMLEVDNFDFVKEFKINLIRSMFRHLNEKDLDKLFDIRTLDASDIDDPIESENLRRQNCLKIVTSIRYEPDQEIQ